MNDWKVRVNDQIKPDNINGAKAHISESGTLEFYGGIYGTDIIMAYGRDHWVKFWSVSAEGAE